MLNQSPLASFCVFTYNQEAFISDAIRGALSQEYDNLEIIISDDCSTDNTFSIIKSEISQYGGNHTIKLLRNDRNLGIAKHVCKVLYEEAKGEYIILSAGDDISLPSRTKVCVSFLQQHPEVTSLSVISQPIDINGEKLPLNSIEKISFGQSSIFTLADYVNYSFMNFSGDSRVLRKSVIKAFPPLEFSNAEDIYFFIRSLYLGSIALLRIPLVLYRQHPNSAMGKIGTRKKVTERDMINYNNSKKQIYADFEYAFTNGYVNEEYRNAVSNKINEVVLFLHPQNWICKNSLYKDIAYALNNLIYKCKVSILQSFQSISPNLYFQVRGIYRKVWKTERKES